jgi:hypothetical protein
MATDTMPKFILKLIISIVSLLLLAGDLLWPDRVKLTTTSLCLLGAAILPWLSDLIKSLELPSGFKLEFQQLQGEVARQEQKIDQLTAFLFTHFVTEAEFKHLEALSLKRPYPFERASYFDAELRRLRSLGLIEGWVGIIPARGTDLNQYVRITAKGYDYVRERARVESRAPITSAQLDA